MRSFLELRSVVLSGGSEQDIIEAIPEIVALRDNFSVPLLLELFRGTQSNAVRNAVALGLRDIGDTSAVPTLMEHIIRPENAHTNGTLLYALEKLDAKTTIVPLVHTACSGNYESVAMILNAVEAFTAPLDQGQKLEALSILTKCLQEDTHPVWKREMLTELHEIIADFDSA
jgi:HEAT repeat protein